MNELAAQLVGTETPSILILLLRHRIVVSVIVLGFTLASAAAAFLTTPVYRATAVMLPQTRASMTDLGSTLGGLGSLGSLVGLGNEQSQSTVEAVALLQSRAFAETFIQDHHLIPQLFSNRWDASRAAWRTSWWYPNPPTLYDAYKVFDRKIRHVSQDNKTGLVTLEVDWTNSEVGAEWANEMVIRVNAAMRQRALDEADASIGFLTNELKSAPTIELRDAIARTIDTYVKSRVLAKVRPDYAFRIVDPAEPSGPNDFIRPKRSLYVVSGFCIGLLIASLVVLALEYFRRALADSPAHVRL